MFGLGLEKLHDNSGTQSIHSYTRKEVKKIHYTNQLGDKRSKEKTLYRPIG